MANLLDRAWELALEADNEIAALEAKRAEIDDEIRRLKAFKKAFLPPEQASRPKKAPKKVRIRLESLVQIVGAVLENAGPGEEFSVRHIGEWSGISEATVRNGLDQLRDSGFIRLSRPRADGKSPDLFTIMDAHAFDELIEGRSRNGATGSRV